jgi:hypothetical protein
LRNIPPESNHAPYESVMPITTPLEKVLDADVR